ncbi:MAG TPA: helicase C-terminal domain-containing protein, partial [Candidatus Polarisedimenticolia bacterium]|nr:helicase C-terminal domain-containing protein [Candidatus Polarisedimenticolia bacterium]
MTPRGSPALADVAGLFGDAGPLARVLPAFEPRPQQARMAQEVASCLASGRHLVIEAGTGIGKSIAYLLPAILNSLRTDLPADERRVVVSTHTRALQEQLARKDLPLLQRVLESEGVTFRYALLMGSDNYLCVQRLHEARLARGGLLDTRGEMSEALARHARSAVSGLRSEIPFVVPDGLWSRVHRDRDICLGVRGPFWEDCLYRRDLARARESDLLIVNHALFFLDLKTGGRILPPHGVVILDEAHRIEEAVVAQFGLSVSDRSVARFLEDLGSRERGRSRKVRAREAGDAEREVVPDLLPRLREAAATFFDEVRRRTLDLPHAAASASDSAGPARLVRLRQPGLFEDRLRAPLLDLQTAMEERGRSADPATAPALASLGARARDLRERLTSLLEQRLADAVYWVEIDPRRGGAALHAAPIEVAQTLRRHLFESARTAVLTSATLAAAGSFSHVRRRLGVVAADEVVLGSPYDYREQSLLYVPASMPDPVAEPDGFRKEVTSVCRRLLRASGGGAFVLFTSYSLLRQVHQAIADDADLRDLELFRHEPGQASSILERFRLTRTGALFGTMTFWQGVDVPGEALRLVIITRLPFEVPGHPIFEARAEAIRARGGDPFVEDALPEAILTFRQGFGRLIRSR